LVRPGDRRYAVCLGTGGVWPDGPFPPARQPRLNLPRVVAAAAAGSTVVAVVDAKPPLLVSHDAGTTWRDSGRGLAEGRAVAIDDLDPDVVVFATRNRLHLSRDGGPFWTSVPVELPATETVAPRSARP